MSVDGFGGLDRYREHDVDVIIASINHEGSIFHPDQSEENGEGRLKKFGT
jgi:imidazoleglycerol phosphate synthase glutamine amidotransferase subunit HisH